MATKTNNIIASLPILILLSCCTGLKKTDEQKKTESFFSVSEEYLPNFLDSSYTLIYRIGSIEWSPYITVLALKSEKGTSKSSSAFLWQFNFSIEGKRSFMYETNYMNSYKIGLANNNIKAVERLKLNSNDSLFNTYNFNGEGKCNNIYVIRKFGNSECLIIDKHSTEQNKNLIKEIFKGISAQEHFQLFSLEKNCEQLDSLAHILLQTGYIDPKYSYQIDYNKIKPIPKIIKTKNP